MFRWRVARCEVAGLERVSVGVKFFVSILLVGNSENFCPTLNTKGLSEGVKIGDG